MATPRVKRPFAGAASDPSQRQITSFFSQSSTTSSSPAASEPLRSPPLPANVESNLLSVGMRIRKSVPEGYKTTSDSAFKLWTDNTPLPTGPTKSYSSTPSKASARELLPFCGINKVGGLDTQPEVRVDTEDDDDVPGLDEMPELTMSQESTDSVASGSNGRKRFFADDDDEVVDPVQSWMTEDDAEISPLSFAPGSGGNSRVMAVPRSRTAKRAPIKETMDQENMAVDGDFEDADFLVFGHGREMDMSG